MSLDLNGVAERLKQAADEVRSFSGTAPLRSGPPVEWPTPPAPGALCLCRRGRCRKRRQSPRSGGMTPRTGGRSRTAPASRRNWAHRAWGVPSSPDQCTGAALRCSGRTPPRGRKHQPAEGQRERLQPPPGSYAAGTPVSRRLMRSRDGEQHSINRRTDAPGIQGHCFLGRNEHPSGAARAGVRHGICACIPRENSSWWAEAFRPPSRRFRRPSNPRHP